MQYPNSGRIVVVDDKYAEAKPLLQVFSKNQIPYIYFDGTLESLPGSPCKGIRFVFLDIQLVDGDRANKSIASRLTSVLKKIVAVNNGPFFILFWSRHSEIIELVLHNCSKASINPVGWVDMEKSECLTTDNAYDLTTISEKLRHKLSDIGAFQLYIEWENIVNDASKQFVFDFSNLAEPGLSWSKQTSALFYKLYKLYVDKNVTEDNGVRFKYAGRVMNMSFYDVLQSKANAYLNLPEGFSIIEGDVGVHANSKINSSLMIDFSAAHRISSGCVFFSGEKKLKNYLNSNIFLKGKVPSESQLVEIIITPECDLAQKKTLTETNQQNGNIDEKVIHRVVFGLMFETFDCLSKIRKKTDALFEVGKIWYKDSEKIIIIHLSTISLRNEKELKKPIFSFKREILFDLQSKASNHINRLGNMQL